jgi:hypothetical protein
VEELFVCKKPPVGESGASVLVDDDGVAIVHQLVKGQLEIPKAQITGVVLHPGRLDDPVALRRHSAHALVGVVGLPAPAGARVVIVIEDLADPVAPRWVPQSERRMLKAWLKFHR